MNRVLCSSGAVTGRANGNNFRLLPALDALLPCDGWEFMMTSSMYSVPEEEIRAACEGLSIPVFHCRKDIGEQVSLGNLDKALTEFERNCSLARALGAELLVLHLWNGLTSDQHMERNIAAYAPLRESAERHGLLLTIENVICNQRDPMTHLHALLDIYPDIAFTFDTKMAAFHGQLDALYQAENRRLLPHIRHLHVNDYAGGVLDWANMRAKPLGQGHIDFERFFAFLRRIGYGGNCTYEASGVSPDGTIRMEEVTRSLEIIRRGRQK